MLSVWEGTVTEPGVDVIVPCYNGARYLAATLDSVLGQSYDPLRVLVVDDGSTDGTRQVVESYGGRVDYVHKENGGQASARNLGIARTHGEYVYLVDADDLLLPETVNRLVRRLEDRPNADFVHGRQLSFRGEDSVHAHAESWRPGVAWGSYLEALSVLCAIHGSSTLFRRRTFERFGHFPEARSLQGCEDWHFWLQAVLQGAVIESIPDVVCLYRYHAGNSSFSRHGVARRESELMKAAVGLYELHGAFSERSRSVLAIGMAAVAARWLVLREPRAFEELDELARRVAPSGFRSRYLGVESSVPEETALALLQLRLAAGLLDLGLPVLAAVLYLRFGGWRELPGHASRLGQERTFDAAMAAMLTVVEQQIVESRAAGIPSFATHLASGLGLVARARGDDELARRRFEEALVLDANNVTAGLELLALDLRGFRLRRALARAKALGERGWAPVAADLLVRFGWSALRRLGIEAPFRRTLARNPWIRERARGLLLRGRPFAGRRRAGSA